MSLSRILDRIWFPVVVIGLGALRFVHLRPFLDSGFLREDFSVVIPPVRQASTAVYALTFYTHGFDIFTPRVNWLGSHANLAMEFPLFGWFNACLYLIFGPTLIVDRFVYILCFFASAYFLYRVVAFLFEPLLARLALVLYMAVPLGIYYSRAVHFDFAVLGLSLALFYYSLRYLREEKSRYAVLAVLTGSIAFLVKAPYAFYFFFPLIYFAWRADSSRRKKLLSVCIIFAIPVVLFLLWRIRAEAINAAIPDYSFLPGWKNWHHQYDWFFGRLVHRWRGDLWFTVAIRFFVEFAGGNHIFIVLPFVALLLIKNKTEWKVLGLWTLGLLVYLLLFFRLIVMHNYYFIPFVPVYCILAAYPLYRLWKRPAGRRIGRIQFATVIILLFLFIVLGAATAFRNYYKTFPYHEAVGAWVRNQTEKSDLVIFAHSNLIPYFPYTLYTAKRNGWNIDDSVVVESVISKFRQEGGRYLVVSDEPRSAKLDFLRKYSFERNPGLRIRLYDLKKNGP